MGATYAGPHRWACTWYQRYRQAPDSVLRQCQSPGTRPVTSTSTIAESGAVTQAHAHVLDIELTKPVTGLQRATPNGLQAEPGLGAR